MTKTSKTDGSSSKSKTNNAHPVHNEPAFIIENIGTTNENALVLADLHYGIEYSLAEAGARVPSQTENITQRVISLCKKLSISHLILLGDIKHQVPGTSKQEWYELPEVFRRLARTVESIDILPGNHDGGLWKIIPRDIPNIKTHPNSGAVLFGLGLFHGHTWPKPLVFETQLRTVLMAHNHPHVLFIDKLGGRASFPCWVRARLDAERIKVRYPNLDKFDSEIIILPAFNDLGTGTAITAPKPEFLGPLLKNNMVDTQNAEVYLLDGTSLGKLHYLIEINISENLVKKRFKSYS